MRKVPTRIYLFSLLILGFALRIYHLAYFGLWYDELLTIYAALRNKYPWDIYWKHLHLLESHPIGHVLFVYFSHVFFPQTDFGYRLPSVLLGIALLYCIYATSKRLFSERIGLIAMTLATFSLPLITASRQCRYFIPFAFLAVAYQYYMCELWKNFTLRTFLKSLVFTTLLGGVHYLGTFIALFGNFFPIWKHSHKTGVKKKALLFLFPFLLVLPNLYSFFYLLIHVGQRTEIGWVPPVNFFFFNKLFDYLFVHGDFSPVGNEGSENIFLLLFLLVALSGIALYLSKKFREPSPVRFYLFLTLSPMLIFLCTSIFTGKNLLLSRSFCYLTPLVLILLAICIDQFRFRKILVLSFAALNLFFIFHFSIYTTPYYIQVAGPVQKTIDRYEMLSPDYVYCEEPFPGSSIRYHYPVLDFHFLKRVSSDRVHMLCDQEEASNTSFHSNLVVTLACLGRGESQGSGQTKDFFRANYSIMDIVSVEDCVARLYRKLP